MNISPPVLVIMVLAVSAASATTAYGAWLRQRRPWGAVAGPVTSGRSRAGVGSGRARGDRGASALEWAVISAILVTAAVVIGGVIYNVVSDKSDQISSCGALGADAESCTEP